MSLNLLGVRPTAPGFAEWEVRPYLTASLMQVKGVVPTVRGAFEVSFNLNSREANVTVPSGILAAGRVGIALVAVRAEGVSVGGSGGGGGGGGVESRPHLVTLTVNGTSTAVGPGARGQDHAVHWVEGLGAGTHTLRWRLSSDTPLHTHPEAAGANAAATLAPTPFPEPARYAMRFVGRDDATKGDWQGVYGANGFHFFHFCASGSNSSTSSTTCGVAKETQNVELRCGGANNTIRSVAFADFGTAAGDCSGSAPFAHDPTCTTPRFATTVAAQCVGARTCSVECSDYSSLGQQGCTFRADERRPVNVTLPIACDVAKTVKLAVTCTTPAPTCVESVLPPFIRAVTNAYGRGHLAPFSGGPTVAGDPRALQRFNDSAHGRSAGKLAEEVVLAVDIFTATPNAAYRLAAYFVDWESQGRAQQVSILNATDATFPIAAPSQLLERFGGGAYLVWELRGDVRLRIAHVGTYPGGADALVSGIFFD
jgi:hypothetical protein